MTSPEYQAIVVEQMMRPAHPGAAVIVALVVLVLLALRWKFPQAFRRVADDDPSWWR